MPGAKRAKDKYGRTLAYLLLDGRNVSELLLRGRLAVETIGRYGDNGLPKLAEACKRAAKEAGPVPFEDPREFRYRSVRVAELMKAQGTYPLTERR